MNNSCESQENEEVADKAEVPCLGHFIKPNEEYDGGENGAWLFVADKLVSLEGITLTYSHIKKNEKGITEVFYKY